MRIKKLNEATEVKTFENTQPHELALMLDNEIIDLISNTFKSKVVSSDPNWLIIESDWKHIENDPYLLLWNDKLIGKTYKVYFHIFKDDFLVIRGNTETLQNFLDEAQSKFPEISKSGGTEGSSIIIKGRMFPNLLFALAPIPKGQDVVIKDGEYYSLSSMSCSIDITMRNKNIAYYSNLLIGSTLDLNYK